uniref:Putative secreted protein n=1 Tax=Amblyomma cajennense TaxID=34607 RepID=A0A023FRI3_AMBCJ
MVAGGNRMFLLLAVFAMAVPFLRGAPATKFYGGNIPISIKLPDSDELVKTDVPSQSSIPECLKALDGVTENESGLVVPAEAYTQCARQELGRLQSELKPSEADKDDSSEEEPVEDDVPPPPAAKAPEPEPEPEPKKDVPAPPKEVKPYFPEAPTIPDLTSITDAFTKVKPIDKNPTVLGEVVKILQVIFDFRRVMSDMQRILHGDLHGVLQEYPERARGFFQMVSSLPSRFSLARDKVEEVKEESKEPEYVSTLKELQNYLTSAGASSQELPNALSLVSTMDALRTIAGRLQNHLTEGLTGRKRAAQSLTQRSQPQSKLLDEVKDIFLIIPDTFRAYGRRSKLNGGPGIFSPSPVSPLSPWNPLNPLSPISPLSAASRLTPLDPLGPVSRAQVGAVDAISKRLTDLFSSRSGNKRQ